MKMAAACVNAAAGIAGGLRQTQGGVAEGGFLAYSFPRR
jgi:hypothetical protein